MDPIPPSATSRVPIFIPKLDDENYFSWLSCVTNALIAHQSSLTEIKNEREASVAVKIKATYY